MPWTGLPSSEFQPKSIRKIRTDQSASPELPPVSRGPTPEPDKGEPHDAAAAKELWPHQSQSSGLGSLAAGALQSH